jgi:hypothetical protein
LLAVQRLYGGKVREQTMKCYGRLVDAHLLITGVLSKALFRMNGKLQPTTPTSKERGTLFASFVIGLDTCEGAIAEGRYLQALALIRQEMETLAQLKAVSAGTRKEKRSPNVAVLESSLARLYGDLSAAAHVSNHDLVRTVTEYEVTGDHLPGPTSGTRYFPAFDEGVARRCFGLHISLTFRLIEELNIDLIQRDSDEQLTEREIEAINLALQLMQLEGMVEIDER